MLFKMLFNSDTTKTSCPTFFILHLIAKVNWKMYLLLCECTHTYANITLRIEVIISQTDVTVTCNCVTVSKWFFSLFYMLIKSYQKSGFILSFFHKFGKPKWKDNNDLTFHSNLTNNLSILKDFHLHIKGLWNKLYIMKNIK